jgi:hypothetical protein
MRSNSCRWLIAAGALVVACAGELPQTADDQELAETIGVFGLDRVTDALKGKPKSVPADFAQYEALFKVGRKCARQETKEIFIVEESSTREGGKQVYNTNQLLPRAVITGCNTTPENPDAIQKSFELMAALISSPNAKNAGKGDPMLLTPVEVLALDRRTGTYNFYVMVPQGSGLPGKLVRVMRMPDGKIRQFEMGADGKSKASTVPVNPCFSCHVNGGPLMNEMARPWENWVSVLNQLPKGKLTGETQKIVSEAADSTHSRASLANDLEPIMRTGIQVWIDGNLDPSKSPPRATTGFGQMTLEGTMPGGLGHLLKSSFCETELQYVSTHESQPMELFVDPEAATFAGVTLVAPDAAPDLQVKLMPQRSEHDRATEVHLLKRGYMTVGTRLAIRLIDEENDIFSSARCGLWKEAVTAVGKPAKPSDGAVKIAAFLNKKAKDNKLGTISKARRDYIIALTDPKATDEVLEAKRTAWQSEFEARYEKARAQVESTAGIAALEKKVKTRQDKARAMFPGDATPLPLF